MPMLVKSGMLVSCGCSWVGVIGCWIPSIRASRPGGCQIGPSVRGNDASLDDSTIVSRPKEDSSLVYQLTGSHSA